MKAAFDIAAVVMLHETLPTIAAFLREQGTGLSFDQLLAQVSPSMRQFFEANALGDKRPPQAVYDTMLAQRDALKQAVRRRFAEQRVAAMMFPAVAALPAKIGEEEEVEVNGKKISFFEAYGRNTALSPAAGTPALVLPAGMAAQGLPVALEFNALPGQDRALLALGLSIERVLGTISAPKQS